MSAVSPDKRCILVLGMHRSGTSAVAGVLDCLGAGPPAAKLLGPSQSNRGGHFEVRAVVDFNDQLLAGLHSGWADWRSVSELSTPAGASDAISEMANLISDWFAERELVTVKDPRICRLVPIWRTILAEAQVRPLVLIPYRNPLSVAASLHARDGFPEHAGLHLWLRHTLDAEAGTRDLPRAVLRYDLLLTDWRNAAARISRDLNLRWPISAEAAAAEVEAFLSAGERHQNASDADLQKRHDLADCLREWALITLEAFEVLSQDPTNAAAQAQLDAIRASFQARSETEGAVFYDYVSAILALSSSLSQSEGGRQACEADRARILASASWRATAPLRTVYDAIARLRREAP